MASTGTKHDFLNPPQGSEDHLGTLGHYRVIDELGKGGMGFVFLAEDTRLKRDVALKVMNQKIASTPGSRKRFISEARSMASVHHDNVATIFEVGEYKGTPFMAMELLEGSTLENYWEQNGEPDFHLLIAYARDIARGLAAAHAQGIVHRDIKPANIWLDTKTNRIKILDFGLALAQTPVDQLSGRGAVVGTPGYLSPEQARSEPLDDRSDLYSTGVVLYELATGSLPLKSKTVAEQLIAILVHAPKPVRQRNENIPQPLADLIHKLMAKEPRDRYRNAVDLEQALDKVEVECESKTEVAQAINKLQLGLEQAVNKKKTGVDENQADLIPTQAATPNPFEMLPDVLPAATPIATGVSSSGVHAAIPLASGPLASGLAGNRSAAKNKPRPQRLSSSKVIWIAVGVVAVLLLLLIPAIVFLSDSSAIARQQNQAATIVGSDPAPTPSSSVSNSKPNSVPVKPKPKPKPQPKNKPSGPPKTATPPVTKVNAKEVTEIATPNSKWILGEKQNNGSFEQSGKQGQPSQNQLKIPGWTAKKTGGDAGWQTVKTPQQAQAKTFAYAGVKSQLVLTSAPLKHQTKAGDVFRISLNIGGEGQGKSDYRVVLGFKGGSGAPVRYQLAQVTDSAKWTGGKQKRLRYEYAVPAKAAGKKPFVELTLSNANGGRKRAMLDQVAMTVESKQAPAPKTAVKPQSKPTGKPDPSMVASQSKPAIPPAKPNVKPAVKPVPKPVASGPKVVRKITIKTTDQYGADATIKRGSTANKPLGLKPTLVIQTRNNIQVQHVYIRFPLTSLRTGNSQNANQNRRGGGNNNVKALPVVTAQLQLTLTSAKRPGFANVRVYGLDQAVSDTWPEKRIAWSRSISDANGQLEKLPLLAEVKVGPSQQTISISNEALAKFVANSSHLSVTLILTGSTGNELVTLASKEATGAAPPTLVLGLSK